MEASSVGFLGTGGAGLRAKPVGEPDEAMLNVFGKSERPLGMDASCPRPENGGSAPRVVSGGGLFGPFGMFRVPLSGAKSGSGLAVKGLEGL